MGMKAPTHARFERIDRYLRAQNASRSTKAATTIHKGEKDNAMRKFQKLSMS
jgi:hypothetical protein